MDQCSFTTVRPFADLNIKSIGVLMANMFVDKRKKYGNEPRGAANPIRQCVDEYQFSPTSQSDFFPSLIPNRKRGEGSSIICQVSKISSPPNTPWDPTMSFVLLPNSNSAAVFLIACHKNGSGTFAQICKLESPETDAATLGKKQMELLQNVVRFSF